jgi:3-oxoacyl-(acyl-carrier-protein) synthase
MTTSVYGIGWFTSEGYGCVRSSRRRNFENGEGPASLPKKGIFRHPFKNFGRMDGASRAVAYGVALALQDAGIEYSPGKKRNIGIIGTSREGSLRADIEFFKDYLRSGRTLSRGNLFIYTLPSSPLGEAAIHFGFLGPLLYGADAGGSLLPFLDMASEMVAADEAELMLAGQAEEDHAVYLVIGKERDGQQVLCSLSEARSIIESDRRAASIVEKFLLLSASRKAIA